MLKQEKKKSENQQKIIDDLTETLKAIENNLLQETREKENTDNSNKALVIKCEEIKNKLETEKKKSTDILAIKEQREAELKMLEETIEKLKSRQLSSSTLFDTIEGVVASLKDSAISEVELEKYIKSNFTKKDSLVDALQVLQKRELESMTDICNKMDNNNIVEEDLTTIRNLENDICVEFLICKCMHSLCTRYLNQMAQKKDLYETIQDRC